MLTSGEGIKNSSSPRIRWSRLAGLIAVTLAIIYVFSRFIPAAAMQDYVAYDHVDNSWGLALHEAFVERLQFGTEFVFTYGPWGFLARNYHPQTHLLSVIVWSGLALAFMSAAWQLARQLGVSPIFTWAWIVLLAALATTPAGNDFDCRLVLFVTLPLLLHFFTERTAPAKAALVISLGCLSLVKFTGLVEAGMVVMLISVDDVVRRRQFPWVLPLWAASLFCFWVLAWQRLDGFGAFLVNSWQVASGYTEAMMLPGNAEPLSLWGYVIIALALWLLAAWGMAVKLRGWAGVPLMGIGMVLFIAFKLGYVRQDNHQMNSAICLLVVAALLLPLAKRGGVSLKVAAVGLMLVAGIFGAAIFHRWPAVNGLATQLTGTFRISNVLAPLAAATTGYLQTSREKELARIAAKDPLPPIVGGVDIYSRDQAVLFAHGLHYQPRPVIQSYAAYTPALAKLNAGWLRSEHAASNILFAVQPLAGQFPTLDDGLSWPELLTRYSINHETSPGLPYLLLQRDKVPRGNRLVSITNSEVAFGVNVTVPAVSNAPVWVEIGIKKSFAGKLISAAYKPPVLIMAVNFKNRPTLFYRIVPGLAQTGFLLSPVIGNTKSFAALFESGWQNELVDWEVQSMEVVPGTASRSSICYEPMYTVRFYRLEISR